MRDFSADHRWLSLNTATVRKQGDLVAIIDACARHGIRAIDPWRDQVATVGVDRAGRAVRDAGLDLSGYCRGGMFTSDAAHRSEVRDDNRRCVDEAKAHRIELEDRCKKYGYEHSRHHHFDESGAAFGAISA